MTAKVKPPRPEDIPELRSHPMGHCDKAGCVICGCQASNCDEKGTVFRVVDLMVEDVRSITSYLVRLCEAHGKEVWEAV